MRIALNHCIFAVRTRTDPRVWEERIDHLAALYRPLRPARPEWWAFEEIGVVVGRLAFAHVGGEVEPFSCELNGAVLLAWGGPVPVSLRSPQAVLSASPEELRQLDHTVALIAADGDRLVVAGGASGASAMYAAERDGTVAWATHAAAASLLARGRIEIDWAAVPEFLATDCVAGTDTHLRGVRAFPNAWSARVQGQEVQEASYWPPRERWRLHPEEEAQQEATKALLRTLDSKLSDLENVHCALSGGLDSCVVAIALREIGRRTRAFTHGAPGWADMVEAARVAAQLGLPHVTCEIEWNADADARAVIAETALWSDGLAPSHGFGLPQRAPRLFAAVTGNGGEIGRAWYYKWLAWNYADPAPDHLVGVLGHLHRRIAGADAAVHSELDDRLRNRIDAVQAQTGLTGWRTLDVLYEGRGRRFVRARLPRTDAYALAGLSAVDLNSAVVSLPKESRVADGFHRGFIAQHAPALVPQAPHPAPRRFVPPALRRLRHRLRSRQAPPPQPWFMAESWPRFQETRRWMNEGVLADTELRANLGEDWVQAIADGFANNDSHATETTLRVASLIALRDQAVERGL